MPNLVLTHSLTKLSHLKKPMVTKGQYQYGPIPESRAYSGTYMTEPEIGKSFRFMVPEFDNLLITSTVKATYSPSQVLLGKDKLVLPSGFPEPEKLDIPELLSSDVLIATSNSLYLLREIAGIKKI